MKNSIWDRKLVVALVEALEGVKDWNLSLKIEDMLKIVHDLENLEQDAQYQRRRIDEQIEEAKSLMKRIDMNFHSQSEIDKLVREAKEHEKEANRRYDEYLKSKDKE
ncbi:hypothetical protein AOD82_0202945 [Helicobacter pylori]|nr:hypothetical protein AOD79_0205220 [Helicobacter pylori]OKB12953.1 hypothetical protein AOD80_0204025 [Helicobacter pylori]OKB22358.1 hypothetical protein AOD81_0205120 [Helicobacter pylori]OKB24896.1 hypothetical protein AOD82_0202945 [Helicobacter pylori]